VQCNRNIVEALQSQGDFADVRIPRPLAHAVDRSLNPGCSSTYCGHGTCCCQSKIVMPMPVQGNLRTHPTPDLANQELSSLRPAGADSIHNHDFSGTSLESGEINLLQEIEFRPRTVHGEVGDLDPVLFGERNRVYDATQHFVARHSVGFQLDVAGGRLDNRGPNSKSN